MADASKELPQNLISLSQAKRIWAKLFYIFSHHWRHSTPALFVSRLVTNPRFKA
jgi:hypothetical protein